jgi:hypothetical protein
VKAIGSRSKTLYAGHTFPATFRVQEADARQRGRNRPRGRGHLTASWFCRPALSRRHDSFQPLTNSLPAFRSSCSLFRTGDHRDCTTRSILSVSSLIPRPFPFRRAVARLARKILTSLLPSRRIMRNGASEAGRTRGSVVVRGGLSRAFSHIRLVTVSPGEHLAQMVDQRECGQKNQTFHARIVRSLRR